jgi:glycosyltransferase involved in cell wall biosynthesis
MATESPTKILVSGGIGGSGGYFRYCVGLFASGNWPLDMPTTFVGGRQFLGDLGRLDPSIQTINHPWPESECRWQRYVWHLIIFPRVRRRVAPDIEFYPGGDLRAFRRRLGSVTACHNLLPFDDREIARYRESSFLKDLTSWRQVQSRAFLRSSGVIFFSEHSRDHIVSLYPDITRCAVIPHGLEEEFRLPPRTSYQLSSPVTLLYASPVFRYKHHDKVIAATNLMRKRTGLDIRLRIIGGGRPEDVLLVRQVINKIGGSDYVTLVPFATRSAMLKELKSADICVFASSCETFGITLLEAMGARLPIVCSNRSGLPSILGEAGEYCDPEVPESIAEALNKLLSREEHRRVLGEQAFTRSLAFTWARCASQTAAFLRGTR